MDTMARRRAQRERARRSRREEPRERTLAHVSDRIPPQCVCTMRACTLAFLQATPFCSVAVVLVFVSLVCGCGEVFFLRMCAGVVGLLRWLAGGRCDVHVLGALSHQVKSLAEAHHQQRRQKKRERASRSRSKRSLRSKHSRGDANGDDSDSSYGEDDVDTPAHGARHRSSRRLGRHRSSRRTDKSPSGNGGSRRRPGREHGRRGLSAMMSKKSMRSLASDDGFSDARSYHDGDELLDEGEGNGERHRSPSHRRRRSRSPRHQRSRSRSPSHRERSPSRRARSPSRRERSPSRRERSPSRRERSRRDLDDGGDDDGRRSSRRRHGSSKRGLRRRGDGNDDDEMESLDEFEAARRGHRSTRFELATPSHARQRSGADAKATEEQAAAASGEPKGTASAHVANEAGTSSSPTAAPLG